MRQQNDPPAPTPCGASERQSALCRCARRSISRSIFCPGGGNDTGPPAARAATRIQSGGAITAGHGAGGCARGTGRPFFRRRRRWRSDFGGGARMAPSLSRQHKARMALERARRHDSGPAHATQGPLADRGTPSGSLSATQSPLADRGTPSGSLSATQSPLADRGTLSLKAP